MEKIERKVSCEEDNEEGSEDTQHVRDVEMWMACSVCNCNRHVDPCSIISPNAQRPIAI